MEKIKNGKVMGVLGSLIALFALMVTTLTANSACMYIAHQPEMPAEAKKLRKF